MRGRAFPVILLAFRLLLALPLGALGPGEVSAGLEGRGMSLGLRLGGGQGELRLGLEADAEEARLRAGFRSPSLVAGPGSATGPLRALADPAAFGQGLAFGLRAESGPDADRGTTLGPGFAPPLALDPALKSGTSVLGVAGGLGPLAVAAFALAPGLSGGFLIARPGPGAPPEALAGAGSLEPPAAPEAASAGLAFRLPLGRGGLCLAAGGVYRRGSEGEGGWSPDPPPEPPSRGAYAALVAEGGSGPGRAVLALAASYGARQGPGLAFRLEAFAAAGPLGARAFAGAAGAAFRNLYGQAPSRRLGAGLDLRLALYRGASLALAARLESPAPEPARPAAEGEAAGLPSLGRSGSLGLSLPLARAVLEPRLELSLASGETEVEALAALRLKGEGRGFPPAPAKSAARNQSAAASGLAAAAPDKAATARSRPGFAWRLELEDSFLLKGGGFSSLDLSLGLKSRGSGPSPRLVFDLELRLRPAEGAVETASSGTPAPASASLLSAAELAAKARLGLELPLRAGARLELEACLEEAPLALFGPEADLPGLELSAAYRAPLGP